MEEKSSNEKINLPVEMDWAILETFSQSALSSFVEEIEKQASRVDIPLSK